MKPTKPCCDDCGGPFDDKGAAVYTESDLPLYGAMLRAARAKGPPPFEICDECRETIESVMHWAE